VALARTRALYAAMDAQERAEGALRQAQKMEAIGQLTGGIAHDFNNLLMVMMGGADRLRRDLTEPKHVRTLDMITQAAKRGENLIRHLLTFSRRQSTNPTLLDVSHFLAQVDEVLRGTLPGNIRLNVEPAASPCVVRVDAGELELAVLNLAVNARDAMPNGGALTLSAVPVRLNAARDDEGLAGDFVALRVRDTGEGIPDEVLPKVFEPFFTTKAAGRGTGLGLSQVYGFAKQASGTVRIETTPGRGTTVTLLLPRAAEQELAQAQPAPAATTARILLVEDSTEVAQVTNDYLERLGHAVEVVPSAQDALALLRAKSDPKAGFDLVLSDIVMPGEMDGLDLARRVHAEFANLPIVLVTGYSASADAARREGFEVLRKPYTVDRLAQAIDRHLSRPPQAAAG
jgi:two-component system NtrC family sensor kinase